MSQLYEARLFTKRYMEAIAARRDVVGPVLDVGPMQDPEGDASSVFARWPDTYVDARKLFIDAGYDYMTVDINPTVDPDVVGNFLYEDSIHNGTTGTLILFHVLEHEPSVFQVGQAVESILKPGGRCFVISPWDVEIHAPSPDCWRISTEGYQYLFRSPLRIVETGRWPDDPHPAVTYAEILKP